MKTILIVEDTKAIRDELLELLEIENYNVLVANNGKEGVACALERLPDLILSDIAMPIMDGFQMLFELKKEETTRFIPAIFLTARNNFESIRKGMEIGADDYLPKPVSPDVLLKAIETQLQKKTRIDGHLDRLTQTITSTLPHEMRTPLHQIIGFSSLLIETQDQYNKDDIRQMASYILDGGERLLRLIENYLTYTELKLEVKTDFQEQFNQIHTIQQASNKVATLHKRTEDIVFSGDIAILHLPQTRIAKLTEELIDNALKFSLKGEAVRISVISAPNKTILEITNPTKVNQSQQKIPLEAFTQNNRQVNEQQGLGLGLAIVQLIVQLYNGQLFAENNEKNQFKIRIEFPYTNK